MDTPLFYPPENSNPKEQQQKNLDLLLLLPTLTKPPLSGLLCYVIEAFPFIHHKAPHPSHSDTNAVPRPFMKKSLVTQYAAELNLLAPGGISDDINHKEGLKPIHSYSVICVLKTAFYF